MSAFNPETYSSCNYCKAVVLDRKLKLFKDMKLCSKCTEDIKADLAEIEMIRKFKEDI